MQLSSKIAANPSNQRQMPKGPQVSFSNFFSSQTQYYCDCVESKRLFQFRLTYFDIDHFYYRPPTKLLKGSIFNHVSTCMPVCSYREPNMMPLTSNRSHVTPPPPPYPASVLLSHPIINVSQSFTEFLFIMSRLVQIT